MTQKPILEFIFQITDFFWQNGRRVSTGTGNSDAHVLWAMPKGRTGQQKVPILKKATGLCISRSYYSTTMTCGLSAVAGWWRGCPIRTTDCTDEDSRSLKHKKTSIHFFLSARAVWRSRNDLISSRFPLFSCTISYFEIYVYKNLCNEQNTVHCAMCSLLFFIMNCILLYYAILHYNFNNLISYFELTFITDCSRKHLQIIVQHVTRM